jgi:hypothetical protein
MRRPLWLAAGAALGVGGTLWAERRLRRVAERLTPPSLATETAKSVRRLGDRVQAAVAAGREERERREEELWADLEAGTKPQATVVPERAARRPRAEIAARGAWGGSTARR